MNTTDPYTQRRIDELDETARAELDRILDEQQSMAKYGMPQRPVNQILDKLDNGGDWPTEPGDELNLVGNINYRRKGITGRRKSWRVESILPAGGRLNIFAGPKAGKTTLVSNLVRALVDGAPFLDTYAVDMHDRETEETGGVLIFDTEMTGTQLVEWYDDLGVEYMEDVHLIPLRGRAGWLDFLDPKRRARLVAEIQERYEFPPSVVILDPVGPLLAALGLDENSNSDVQRLLTAWDAFAADLGATESVLAHHAGHAGGRARGASAFHGSGDVNLVITKSEGATGTRRISTTGRMDEELPPTPVSHDPETRRLTLGAVSVSKAREDHATRVLRARMTEVLDGREDGLGATDLAAALQAAGLSRDGARAERDRAVKLGILTRSGGANAYRYTLAAGISLAD